MVFDNSSKLFQFASQMDLEKDSGYIRVHLKFEFENWKVNMQSFWFFTSIQKKVVAHINLVLRMWLSFEVLWKVHLLETKTKSFRHLEPAEIRFCENVSLINGSTRLG